MISHQDDNGTVHELTIHDSPPQNATSERGLCIRAEQAHTLLIATGLPRMLWEEAMEHSAWLQNRTPTHALEGRTPYEEHYKKKLNLTEIQEFGVAVNIKDLSARKLDS